MDKNSQKSSSTVAEFALELKKPTDTLLMQLRSAGVAKSAATDRITESDKHKLLSFLQNSHSTAAPDRKKITLVKKQTSEIKQADASGRARTIQIEVRKKRTFVRREDGSDQSEEVAQQPEDAQAFNGLVIDDAELARREEQASKAPAYWFVDPTHQGKEEIKRFFAEGIWKNGCNSKSLGQDVLSMQPGDRIAMMSTSPVRKKNLPFDNHGQEVPVMKIKAVGTITENRNDGRHIKVDWTKNELDREWFFFTVRKSLNRVEPGEWKSDALIAFTFQNQPQDIERFRNASPGSQGGELAGEDDMDDEGNGDEVTEAATPGYSVDDILKDGCFLKHSEIEQQLDRLRDKKNLILQGPPGTGKTWLAKRLAFALIGQKDESKVRVVQFHPNLSYEDFVRGWRPTGEGKLSLADGVFMEAIEAATKAPTSKFVVVIEEINRGNPAQIFGELLTLLEASKRNPSEALELCYPDADGTRRPVYVPENLYVVGTMNIADRSLALVDLALRRRFAFLSLEPRFGDVWRKWVVKECGVDRVRASDIEGRMDALNKTIAADTRLGKQFQIGHSYVTPNHRLETDGTQKWFQQVVETEIGPLLEEYWFDAPAEAQKARDELLAGW